MIGKEPGKLPFEPLGHKLQLVRQRLEETVAEVSGAVEIDEAALLRIELGQERPSEEILLLLIRHFAIQDDEAVQIWELAGYDGYQPIKSGDEAASGRPLVMVMTVDSRIIYSDKLEVVANQNGVVLNFLQAPAGPYQAQTVARIGMSLEQSSSVLKVLEQTINQANQALNNQKRSPSPNNKKPKSD